MSGSTHFIELLRLWLPDYSGLFLHLSFIRPCRPCDNQQANFSCRRITPATIKAMADKLPGSLAPLCNYSGSVECLTDDLNIALSAAIDSVAPLVIEKTSSLV